MRCQRSIPALRVLVKRFPATWAEPLADRMRWPGEARFGTGHLFSWKVSWRSWRLKIGTGHLFSAEVGQENYTARYL
jgi:hypothetical protein